MSVEKLLYKVSFVILLLIRNFSKANNTTRKVFALRVIAADVQTTSTFSKLTEQIFGSNFSLSSQYQACSFGEFLLLPFNDTTTTNQTITGGVGEVTITDIAIGNSAAILRDSVLINAEEKYGSLSDQFDHVIICLPPGSHIAGRTGWLGYAIYDHWLSVFNDLQCTYPSTLMHEIGHNLGLSHSDPDYDDQSCIMGYTYDEENGPKMCFNGAKSWQLGWYSDAHMSIDASLAAEWEYYEINLVGIANFNERSYEKAIIHINGTSDGNEYFIQFFLW